MALANKESLVVGGAIITELLKDSQGSLIPIDSEHSAMLQSLIGEEKESIEEIIITASGGPFRTLSIEQMKDVTVQQALQHPEVRLVLEISLFLPSF